MTISSSVRKAGPFTGNGITTAFPFAFKVFTAADVLVVRNEVATGVETTLVLNTEYTVSLNADQNVSPGGTVTMIVAPTAAYTLTLSSALDYLQPTDLTNQGGFYPSVITNALDRLTIFAQQLYEQVTRSLKLAISTPAGVNATLPAPVANNLIGWNRDADGFQNVDPATMATLVAYGTAQADIFSGTGSQTLFTLTTNPGSQANLDVSINGTTQKPGIDYLWTSGNNLLFTSAPPVGTNNILVRYMQGLPTGYGATTKVSSFAALAATSGMPGDVVYLIQHTSGGAGGGHFAWFAGSITTDGGTKINAATGGYWQRLYTRLDVKMFGAIGDGTTDDTSAIQKAIDASTNWPSVNTSTKLYIPSGTYKITSQILIRPYLSLEGDGIAKTIIYPYLSSGAAFSSDSSGGVAGAYLQEFHNFAIDGTNCTGTAYAWQFKVCKHTRISQVRFWNFNTTSAAVSIEGALYHLRFIQCYWYQNQKHLQVIATNAPTGQFPTQTVFDTCMFEQSTSTSADVILVQDASAIIFTKSIFQSNIGFNCLKFEATTNASASHDHIVEDCWFEDNGGGQVNSAAIYLKGVSAKKMNGVVIENNRFHQSTANKPNYQIRAEFCDKVFIRKNSEGYGGVFLKDGGNNTNIYIDELNTSQSEIRYPVVPKAIGYFNGKGSIVRNFDFGVANIVRNSAGSYTVTLTNAMASTSYAVTATAEDGSAFSQMICSAVPVTTTTFAITTGSVAGAATDARNISFLVFGNN